MIDIFTRFVDKLIELGQIKERNKEKYFNNFIEPLYRDAEKVANDYIELHAELISRLKRNGDVPKIILWIEDRRKEQLPIRIKLRGTINAYFPETNIKNKFVHGLWWLLRGGLTFAEEGHVVTYDNKIMGHHTVLDLLYAYSQEPIQTNRKRFIKHASQQMKSMEEAWQETNEGYAEIKKKYLS